MELNMNPNSGTEGQFNLTGDCLFDHDGGDDIRVLVDDASSLFNVDGALTVNLNTGNQDDFTFNLDNGEMDVEGDVTLNRANTTAFIEFDMDGGDVNCDDVVITSSGALFTSGAIRFRVDQDSEFNCNSFTSTFTGADDLYIRLNIDGGTSAKFNVTNNMTLNRTAGDDIEIRVDDDDSELTIGGNFSPQLFGSRFGRIFC